MKLNEFIESMGNGRYFTLTTLTEPKMNKRNNPYFGRVTKQSVITGVRTGVSYSNCVDASLMRNNIDDKIEVEKPFGKSWVVPNKILVNDKDSNQLYLRTSWDKSTKVQSSTLYLDGQEITDSQIIEEIKSFMPKPTESKKQADLGLFAQEQINVRDYKFESIQEIKCGDNRVWKKFGKI